MSMWGMGMACMGAWLGGRGLTYGGERTRSKRSERQRGRPPTLYRPSRGTLDSAPDERSDNSATVNAIDARSSMGSRGPLRPLPVATPRPLPCDAAAARLPLRRVCSFFRFSKRCECESLYWRCNASPPVARKINLDRGPCRTAASWAWVQADARSGRCDGMTLRDETRPGEY